MTVTDALSILQAAGTVSLEGDRIRARLPRPKAELLWAAIHVVRRGRHTALRLLRQQDRDAAAAHFIRRAGARLVTPYKAGHSGAEDFTAVLVPRVNDDIEFRAALQKLQLDALPVFYRTEPLDWRPNPCVDLAFAPPRIADLTSHAALRS